MLNAWGVPFAVTVAVILLMILLYTFKGGVKTIVWTDTLQTTFMILALIATVFIISGQLNLYRSPVCMHVISEKGYTQIFDTDWRSKGFFVNANHQRYADNCYNDGA